MAKPATVAGLTLIAAGALLGAWGVWQMIGDFSEFQASRNDVEARTAYEDVSHSKGPMFLKCVAGGLLGFAGFFTLTAAHGLRMHRSVPGFFSRLHGRRVDEEIARLAKLRGDGYITGEEYDEAKKKLLADL